MPKVDDVESATNYANNGGSSWYITSNCKNVELAEDFLASTFGSSTDFYDAILPASGAISCYLPAGESEVYNEPNEFFGGPANLLNNCRILFSYSGVHKNTVPL